MNTAILNGNIYTGTLARLPGGKFQLVVTAPDGKEGYTSAELSPPFKKAKLAVKNYIINARLLWIKGSRFLVEWSFVGPNQQTQRRKYYDWEAKL